MEAQLWFLCFLISVPAITAQDEQLVVRHHAACDLCVQLLRSIGTGRFDVVADTFGVEIDLRIHFVTDFHNAVGNTGGSGKIPQSLGSTSRVVWTAASS